MPLGVRPTEGPCPLPAQALNRECWFWETVSQTCATEHRVTILSGSWTEGRGDGGRGMTSSRALTGGVRVTSFQKPFRNTLDPLLLGVRRHQQVKLWGQHTEHQSHVRRLSGSCRWRHRHGGSSSEL